MVNYKRYQPSRITSCGVETEIPAESELVIIGRTMNQLATPTSMHGNWAKYEDGDYYPALNHKFRAIGCHISHIGSAGTIYNVKLYKGGTTDSISGATLLQTLNTVGDGTTEYRFEPMEWLVNEYCIVDPGVNIISIIIYGYEAPT